MFAAYYRHGGVTGIRKSTIYRAPHTFSTEKAARVWLKACEQVGIVDVHFHDLRTTGLTYLALSGATVRELQVIAGHTTATMAMRYQEVAQEHLTDVYGRLSVTIAAGK